MARVWFDSLRLPLVRETAGSRVYELATTSTLRHFAPPTFDGAVVRAVFVDQGSMGETDAFEVALRQADDALLTGECSHCRMTFGPCVHVTTLLVDIAACRALRDALDNGDRSALAPAATLEDGLMQQRVLDAARKSAAQARWVAV
jgi:hypothetical protein